MILKTPPFAPPQARAMIDKILARGCDCESTGEARLVRRPVGAGGIQITLQCLACGSSIGSPQSHASHPGFGDYPPFDEKLHRKPYNADGDRLADGASALLGFQAHTGHEIFLLEKPSHMLNTTGGDIGLAEAARRRGATRAWTLYGQEKLLGIVCEGEPVEVPGQEIRRLTDGYMALIDRRMIFAFMTEAVRRVRAHLKMEDEA
jgi:hypothetical protein